MPTGKRNFEATITTRYGLAEKDVYQQVIDLVKKNNLAKSRAQLLLVERGLEHTNNPRPLIKEKVVYRDRPGKKKEKVVYKDKVVYRDKMVYRDKEGIPVAVEHVGGDTLNAGQRASADKLTTRDKADSPSSPKTALGEKKSAKEETGIGGWLALSGFLAIVFGPVVYSWLTK